MIQETLPPPPSRRTSQVCRRIGGVAAGLALVFVLATRADLLLLAFACRVLYDAAGSYLTTR